MKTPPDRIAHVRYTPPEPYPLDIEIFSIAERAKKADINSFRGAHRIDFHLLIYVTKGPFTHTVDFQPITCEPGTLLALRPSQIQQFDLNAKWDAWFILFRPEFLLPIQSLTPLGDVQALGSLDSLPVHCKLDALDCQAVEKLITQMHDDASSLSPSTELLALLRHQLYTLLLRLLLIHKQREMQSSIPVASLQRFQQFQQLLEKNFQVQQQVSTYAKWLGVSERTLTRATHDTAGMSAKAFIASRVVLEAKRLLGYTLLPVSAIADRVGFDEPTNFIKFFKKEVGCSPIAFRKQQVTRGVSESE